MLILEDEDYEHALSYCPLRPSLIAFESAYSLLSRFAYYNVLSGKQVVKLFKNKCARRFDSHTTHLSNLFSVDIGSLEQHCSLSKQAIYQLFLVPCHLSGNVMASDILRFCPVCIGEGKHYAIFQFSLLEHCPIHGNLLRVQCMSCGAVTSNTLNAQTFNYPYACWHCHRPLGEGPDLTGFTTIVNTWANLRLAKSYGLLRCRKNSLIHFSLFETSEIYNNSTLQFSRNCTDLIEEERTFYRWLEGLVGASCSSRKLINHFAFVRRDTLRPVSHNCSGGILAENCINLLVGVFKSVFRHIIKKHRICAPCMTRAMSRLRWSVRGIQLPNCCFGITSLIDLRCFWLGEDKPSKLPNSKLLYKNIRAWAARALKEKLAFALTENEQMWLLQHIFVQDVLGMFYAYLKSEVEMRSNGEMSQLLFDSNYASSCWALYFDRQASPGKIFFIGQEKAPHEVCDFDSFRNCHG